jgi:hypothetical protein
MCFCRGGFRASSNEHQVEVLSATTLNFCGECVPIGLRLLVLQANGTPYATVDQIVLTSHGVKPNANFNLKNVALATANSSGSPSCQQSPVLPL